VAPSLIELLVREAPVEDFEAVVRVAREAGATPDELGRLQEEVVRALTLRAVLEERRRRESELGALYQTAGDLTSLRDSEQVLQAIVRRARQLLGTDVAYLMLIDEDRGEAYQRVTAGTATAGFGVVRLPLGVGLGGLVAKEGAPYSSPNYLTDERFDHTRSVDGAVAEEGLIAILGVPLKLAGRVSGVLFAADRHERPFAPQEVALLSSLGAHAAIAIENARLFSETQQALYDLNAANLRIRAHSAAVERAAEAHERFTALVLGGGGLAGVAGALVELLGGGLLVLDPQRRVLASAGDCVDEGHRLAIEQGSLPRAIPGGVALRRALEAAERSGRLARVERRDGLAPRWLAPVIAGSERLGALILAEQRLLDEAELRTLERAALVTAVVLLGQRVQADAEQSVRVDLLGDLLAQRDGDLDRLRRRASLAGLNLDAAHAVVVAAGAFPDRRRATFEAAALAGGLDGLAAEHDGHLVVLLPGRSAADAARLVARRLSTALDVAVTAGAQGPATGVRGVVTAHADAVRCLRVLTALGREGQAAAAEELGAYTLLLGGVGAGDVEAFVHHALGPVLRYDERRGSRLVQTLEAYFAARGNLTSAAEALHVHVNTLYQRLDRIRRLLGDGWQDPDAALQLHLALRLHRLRDPGGQIRY